MLIVSLDGAGLDASAGQISHELLAVSTNRCRPGELCQPRWARSWLEIRPVRKVSASGRAVLDKLNIDGTVMRLALALSSLCVNHADGDVGGPARLRCKSAVQSNGDIVRQFC